MTRTKQVKKRSTMKKKLETSLSSVSSDSSNRNDALNSLISKQYDSPEHFREEFKIYYNNRLEEYRRGFEKACEAVRKMTNDSLEALPEAWLNSEVNATYNENEPENQNASENQNVNPNIPDATKRVPRSRKLSGFEFKRPKTPRLARSSSRPQSSSRKRSLSVPVAHTPDPVTVINSFKTPVLSTRTQMQSVTTITPKVCSNTPISVMRRPLQNEVAFSSSGSPLLIGSIERENIPTVCVPMSDGRVYSILPAPGAPPPECIPEFDDATKEYLRTLRQNLEFLAPNSPISGKD